MSYERVCSGIGLPNLYDFLCERGRARLLRGRRGGGRGRAGPHAGDLRRGAAPGSADPACAAAVSLFARILAQESGNLALRVLGTGGVFLAGGLTRRLRTLLDPAAFSQAFQRKGRLGELIASVPVSLVTADRVALLGAAVRGLEGFCGLASGRSPPRGAVIVPEVWMRSGASTCSWST